MTSPEIEDWTVTLRMPDGTTQVVTRPRYAHTPETCQWSFYRLDDKHSIDVRVNGV